MLTTAVRGLGARWQALLVAVIIVMAFASGAAAKGKYDAKNAERVDSKQAVAATSSATKRKGKLVATSPKTGLLPNNIIASAPDAARLGGYTHNQMSSIPLTIQGAEVSGSATDGDQGDGVLLSHGSTGAFYTSVMLPPDYTPGAPIYADIVFEEDSDAACSWSVTADGLNGPRATDQESSNTGWQVPGSTNSAGTISVPAGNSSTFIASFRWLGSGLPGQSLGFNLTRTGDQTNDSCGPVEIDAAEIRY